MENTQVNEVLHHLETNGSITSWQAITLYKITRLAEYVRQLREEGFEIESNWEHGNGKRWVRYELQKQTVAA